MNEQHKGTVLVVDDDPLNRTLLSANLRESGYVVDLAESGERALDMLNHEADRFDVVLLDLIMPGMDGYEVLERMKDQGLLRAIPVIVISSVEEMDSVVRCIEMGATEHLPKPFNPVLLHARLNASLAQKRLKEHEDAYRKQIEDNNRELEARVREQTSRLRQSYTSLQRLLDDTVIALSRLVERRDPYTAGHQQRVSKLAMAMAIRMKLPPAQVDGIRVGGILHDIGKICVPAEILSKPGKISQIEFGVISTHPEVGFEILKNVEFPWPVAQMVYQHHERLDGTGYPRGLGGGEILPEAKIIGVADVVEAISYHRPYRPALGKDVALEEIARKKGTHFDPAAVEACTSLFNDAGFVFD